MYNRTVRERIGNVIDNDYLPLKLHVIKYSDALKTIRWIVTRQLLRETWLAKEQGR
jgi:hypothetical protein